MCRHAIGLMCLGFGASLALAHEHADELPALEEVLVSGAHAAALSRGQIMSPPSSASSSDAAAMLRNIPGVGLQGAGGVSSLPVIHGLADDRVRIKVDGMNLVSACANHMNSPLSYIDPAQMDQVRVYAGVSPVSMGGDSLGSTIVVNSAAPEFAESGKGILRKGEVAAFYRSNGNAVGGGLEATLASEQLSLTYNGTSASADNFKAADNFKPAGPAAADRGWISGDEVGSTAYETLNQALNIALQQGIHLFEARITQQHIPYQGFPNQRMDMVDNKSHAVNLHYRGSYDWGVFDTRIYREKTRHSMNFGDDKQLLYGDAPGMPMETRGENTGAVLQADISLSERDMLRAGVEYQAYTLDDWWPPSGTGMMMSPNTFWNIRNGQRDRYEAYLEWESRWNAQWISSLGMRSGVLRMNTDPVQGYSTTNGMGMMRHSYLEESTAFNQQDRQRTDHNTDVVALLRYEPADTRMYELGLSRKTRSPNLYERYTWSTSGMSMLMVNFVGDGNGYVGNLALEPETANTLSVTAGWHDATGERWSLHVTPYLTYVEDYIDAARCRSATPACGAANQLAVDQFVYLRFENQAARLRGVDVSGFVVLPGSGAMGKFTAKAVLSYVDGENVRTHDDLYNIMPLNMKVSLEHERGRWTTVLESDIVARKRHVSAVRNEMETSGYALVNWRTSYQMPALRIDVGIDNLIDRAYRPPLAGAYVGQGRTMSGTGVPYGITVPGMGRSFYTGVTYSF